MLRKTGIVLGVSLALVLGTGGAAIAGELPAASLPDVCVPSEGSPRVETTYKDVPNPDHVPGKPAVDHPAETHEATVADQRYSWNPQGPVDESAVEPTWPTPAQGRWTPNTSNYKEGDPLGTVWVASNPADTGAYFYWTTKTVTVVDEPAWVEAEVPAQGEPTIRIVDVEGHDAIPAVTCAAASADFRVTAAPSCADRDGAASLTWEGARITGAAFDTVPMTPAEFGQFYSGDYPGPLAGQYQITLAADPGYSFGRDHTKVLDFRMPDAFTDEQCALSSAGITVPTCVRPDVLPLATNLEPNGWVLKPNSGSAYVEGGLGLDGTVGTGSAWARLDLPAGTQLSDIAASLDTDLVSSSGDWWGGVILEGGELTEQLHYDSDGRFWTAQQGILPDDSLKGGFYESDDLAADLLVDPNVGSLKIYVNEGQWAVVGSQDYGCTTQPFGYVAPLVDPPAAPLVDPSTAPVGTPEVDEVLVANDVVEEAFSSEVLAAGAPAAGELAATGSDGVAITLGSALLLVLSGLSLTVIRRRATR